MDPAFLLVQSNAGLLVPVIVNAARRPVAGCLFVDTRSVVSAEQPRLPLAYYEQRIPVPEGWDSRPCGYLSFGPPYDRQAHESRDRGWLVEHVAGGYLHQVVDPDAVTDRIVAMTAGWPRSAG